MRRTQAVGWLTVILTSATLSCEGGQAEDPVEVVPANEGTDGGSRAKPSSGGAPGSTGGGGAVGSGGSGGTDNPRDTAARPSPDAAINNQADAPGVPVDTVTSIDGPQSCGPTGGGPYWVEEGATVTASFKCANGRAALGAAFTLGTLPKGATYDAATATLRWKTALDQAGVYLIPISVSPWNETAELKIGVADRFDDPTNVPIKDASVYTEEFGLPVFHLKYGPEFDKNLKLMQTQQQGLWTDSCKIQCLPSMYAPMTVVYRGKTFMAEGHYRGASTLWSPKQNFTIRFNKDDKFSEPILGDGKMTKRRRIALIMTLDDNSHLRWRMSFDMWNRLDPKIIRIEHFSAVVYVNGKYVGLYAVSDKIDEDMMKRSGLAEDGNLYMGMSHNANFDTLVKQESGPTAKMARPRNCPFEGFTKKEGLPEECDGATFVPGAYDDLASFIDFVSKSDDTKFRAGVGRMIDVRDYTHWWIHATALIAGDNFGKNALHYHDPNTNGPWRMVLWDYNGTFGQQYNSVRLQPTAGDPKSFAASTTPPVINNIWRRLLSDPTQGNMMRARYAAVLKNEIKVETILAALDAYVKEVQANVPRDERLWGATYKTMFGPTSSAKRQDLNTP